MNRETGALDDKDLAILSAIRHDARKSYEQIGKEVELSRVAVKNRMDAMQDAGVIVEYETKLKRQSCGNAQTFILDIETQPVDYEAVMNLLGKSPYIHQLFAASGNSHIHAIGSVPNTDTMRVYANRLSKELGDVRKFSFHSVLSVRKDVDGGIEYDENGDGTE